MGADAVPMDGSKDGTPRYGGKRKQWVGAATAVALALGTALGSTEPDDRRRSRLRC
jgi:hypothetical protein